MGFGLLWAAQGSMPSFQRLSMTDGLSHDSVQYIMQSQEGFIWIATQYGLNRYDGYQLETFHYDPEISDGISDNFVWSLAEDQEKRLLIGTSSGGLCVFDPKTRTFETYRHDAADPETINHNDVRSLLVDRQGRIWVGTREGLNQFLPESGRFVRFSPEGPAPAALAVDSIHALAEDRRGRIWVGTERNGLVRFDPESGTGRTFSPMPGVAGALQNEFIRDLIFDHIGRLWVATWGAGVYIMDAGQERFEPYPAGGPDDGGLPHPNVRALMQDREGYIWAGTFNGLARFKPGDGPPDIFRNDLSDPYSLSQNRVTHLMQDRFGTIWVGTWSGGVNRIDPASMRFKNYRFRPREPDSLPHNIVRAVKMDRKGRLWVGTLGGGLVEMNRKQGSFNKPPHVGLPDLVMALDEDRRGRIWIGTFDDGVRVYNPTTGTVLAFRGMEEGLRSDAVLDLIVDRSDRVWVATQGGGLVYYDQSQVGFSELPPLDGDAGMVTSEIIGTVYESMDRKLWIGTRGGGLNMLDADRKTLRVYRRDSKRPDSLSFDSITCIMEDRRGRIWIGTQGGGLNLLLSPQGKGRFQVYTSAQGLEGNSIGGILEDGRGNIWLSTIKGISRFNPETQTFKNFDRTDGVQGSGYYIGSYERTDDNLLLFGGLAGLTAFHPDELIFHPEEPPVVITNFLLFNQEVAIRSEDPQSPLTKPVEYNPDIVLKHRDNVFSFEFAALHYAAPQKNRYAYRLEGFDEDWIETDATRRFAVYTNMDHGDYTFRVKAANKDGVWNEEGSTIAVTILPPPWRTWWAYLLYILLVTGVISAYIYSHRVKLAHERAVNERLLQVDRLKDEFLANTGHELRTPLNGIIGLTESVIDGAAGPVNPAVAGNLATVVSCARRLSHLVNDILDFSKIRNNQLELNLKPVDLHALTDITLTLTKPLVGDKPLELINDVPVDFPPVSADENRLQQILHNLVGNAVKFTRAGRVRVYAEMRDGKVIVATEDTGIGIPEDRFDRIFESFEQLGEHQTREYGGTGLGLAVTKQLVTIHGGKIWLESKLGQGSTFFFTLDPSDEEPETSAVVIRPAEVTLEMDLDMTVPLQENAGRFRILIVDDEPVNRKVLVNILGMAGYSILEAEDGFKALEVLNERNDIDLVLLDVMMPRMSGYQVCKHIRETRSFSDLPILFLSAKNQVTDLAGGFSTGGNDYLSKPIAKDELLARVRMHLRLLDITRTLEYKVSERTLELESANRELVRHNRELESLDQVVRSINREVDLAELAETILEEGIRNFPDADVGALLLLAADGENMQLIAARGADLPKGRLIFSREEAVSRYTGSNQISEGIWLVRDPQQRAGQASLKGLPQPKAILAMSLSISERFDGFIVLSNLRSSEAFADTDLNMLMRFREHLISAVAKARYVAGLEKTTLELKETHQRLVEAAHRAGMAEIAVNVIHNIGNTLNHLNAASEILRDKLNRPRLLKILGGVVDLLRDHEHDLPAFFEQDKRGEMVFPALEKVFQTLVELRLGMEVEIDVLQGHISEITAIVRSQEEYARAGNYEEDIDLNALLAEAMKLQQPMFDEAHISLNHEFADLPPIRVQKSKLRLVVMQLFQNAAEMMVRDGTENPEILVVTKLDEKGNVIIEVGDNGPGVNTEIRDHIFRAGVSGKSGSGGFGLHFCANAMAEMNGSIRLLETDAGARFRLQLPANRVIQLSGSI